MKSKIYIEFLNGETITKELSLLKKGENSYVQFQCMKYFLKLNENGEGSLLLCERCLGKAGRFRSEKGSEYKCYQCDFVLPEKIENLIKKGQLDERRKKSGGFSVIKKKKGVAIKVISPDEPYDTRSWRVLRVFSYSNVWREITGDSFYKHFRHNREKR